MGKKITQEIDINVNSGNSIADLKQLKKQLKETAAGSEEFKKLYSAIDDLEDKIKSSKNASKDWIDSLESAGGPLGMLGGALNKAKVATVSFGAALKATGIGLVVSLVAGLVGAFKDNEEAMKKLEPLLNSFQKLFNGIFRAVEPLFNALVDLAIKAMPMVTQAFGVAYSALTSLLQGLGTLGEAIGKLIKGDFTGAWDSAKEAVTGFGKRYDEANKSFISGTNEVTKNEKEALEKRKKAQEEYLKKKLEAEQEAAAQEKYLLEEQLREYERHLEQRKKLDAGIITSDSLKEQSRKIGEAEDERVKRAAATAEMIKNLKINTEDEQLKFSTKNQTSVLSREIDAKKVAVKEQNAIEKWLSSEKKKRLDQDLMAVKAGLNIAAGLVDEGSDAAKAIQVAQTTIDTYQAATAAYAAVIGVPFVGPVLAPIAAGAAIAFGLANVNKIINTKIPKASKDGGGSSSSGGASVATPSFSGTMSVPAPVIGATQASSSGVLGQTIMGAVEAGNSKTRPIQTYVVGDQISTQQQLDRRIAVAAKMGG